MHKLATASSLAAIVLSVAACGNGPAPHGPPYVAPTTAAHNPAIDTQDGVTTPSQALGEACDQLPRGEAPGSARSMSSMPFVAAAATNPMLSTYTQLASKAGLSDAFNHDKEMTAFAPSNDAFNQLRLHMGTEPYNALINNKAKLARLLRYSVVVHRYNEAGLLNAGRITSLQGASLKLQRSDNSMAITDNTKQVAHVLCGNLPTANATVFIIDTVLRPDYPGAATVATS
jgi:uncharacterized surface protein with fasciclin (FAS1) repeats